MRLRPPGKAVTIRVRRYWAAGRKDKAEQLLRSIFPNVDMEDVEMVGTGRMRLESCPDTGYWFVWAL